MMRAWSARPRRRRLDFRPSRAAFRVRPVRSLIIPPPWARRRSRRRTWAHWPASRPASPPSVTTSSRIGSVMATAEVIGSTPSVSTSSSCSIQLHDAVQLAGQRLQPVLRLADAGEPGDLAHGRGVDGHRGSLEWAMSRYPSPARLSTRAAVVQAASTDQAEDPSPIKLMISTASARAAVFSSTSREASVAPNRRASSR